MNRYPSWLNLTVLLIFLSGFVLALPNIYGSADAVQVAVDGEDYTVAMEAMARLRQPVDDFFDRVTVNAEDAALRENRLTLLSAIGATLSRVADFSKIEG